MISNFVFDTNALVSAVLSPFSKNADAIKKAESLGVIVYSTATLSEFRSVLFRPKFDKYFSVAERQDLYDKFLNRFKEVSVTVVINECRDQKDNMFLELAKSSNAVCLISGDADLLVLHPFHGIPVLNASDFLNSF